MAKQRPMSPWIAFAPFFGALAVGALVCSGFLCVGAPCVRTGVRYGMWPGQCPATDLRAGVEVMAYGLVRGTDDGYVELVPTARWLRTDDRDAGEAQGRLSRGFDWTLELRDAAGNPVPGFEIVDVDGGGHGGKRLQVRVPQVPDGDYVLRATVEMAFGSATVDAPLPLYAPAIVHAMTDRPLYRPGQTVLFRSVQLRRTDETPLAGRPGRWVLTDPTGVEVLSEKGAAGDWGVAASSFPLDDDAPVGTWRLAFRSGADHDDITFDVRPFKLPRFSVEARAGSAWYPIGGQVVVEGVARYSSGAPIALAPVNVTLSVSEGRWPMPIDWEGPHPTQTAADGTFRVEYGMVPPDLTTFGRLSAVVEVVEQAGERAVGGASIVLSPEPVRVAALTELGDGLVEGFNNRVYLRVTTPDGRPLPNADLQVTRPYDPTDPGKPTRSDVDGVAVVQLDPGAPVTVVIPASPVRARPMAAQSASITSARDFADGGFDADASRVLETALAGITRCGEAASGDHDVALAVRITEGGAVGAITTAADPVSRCVAEEVRRLRMRPGSLRTWSLGFRVPDAPVPSLEVDQVGPTIELVTQVFDDAVSAARPCVRQDGRAVDLFDVHWQIREGARAVDVEFDALDAPGVSDACVRRALSGLVLRDDAPASTMGVARIILVPAPSALPVAAPQPTTTIGYELAVAATLPGGDDAPAEVVGVGRVVLPVGQVPPMRLRAQPSLAHPGDEVAVEFVRGPSWGSASLPERLSLYQGSVEIAEVKVVDKVATFTLPANADGFLHADFAGARAVVFAAPSDPLALTLEPDQATYEPGAHATLRVTTRRGDRPVQAGVGLVGVDAMLGQLAPLLGPDDYGRVTVRATADAPAFGAFDPKALALGQIRGENAAKAAVARVSQLPMDAAGDVAASANAQSTFDPRVVLVENFYRVLERTTADLATWEASATGDDRLDPARMVAIWNGALDAVEADGGAVVDGYGRRLTLDVVPLDLLAQVDPRRLVSDATHMPEDAEDFVRYVQREVN